MVTITNLPPGRGLGTYKLITDTGVSIAACGTQTVTVPAPLNNIVGFAVTPEAAISLSATVSGNTLTVTNAAATAGSFSYIIICY